MPEPTEQWQIEFGRLTDKLIEDARVMLAVEEHAQPRHMYTLQFALFDVLQTARPMLRMLDEQMATAKPEARVNPPG